MEFNSNAEGLTQNYIENKIFTISGVQVMLDKDLAEMYQTETRTLKQAVKRNINRFPVDFMFELNDDMVSQLVSQSVIPSKSFLGGAKPYVFTEQGVAMLSSIIKTDIAVKASVAIIRAFVQMRKLLLNNAALYQRIDKIELKQSESDQKFEKVFRALESRNPQPDKGVFFDGQIFDAYVFIADLIKKADTNIILIDNYVDETVLSLLSKRKKSTTAIIYTKQINPQMQLDLARHNQQYSPITIETLDTSHDRFLILDHKELYHIGASLKDLGKKWFAFSKMDSLCNELLNKLPKYPLNNTATGK